METERFEALIDAILAIIITIIVLELPLPSAGTWAALYEIRYEFLIYAISFVVCFNFWNIFVIVFNDSYSVFVFVVLYLLTISIAYVSYGRIISLYKSTAN